MRLQGLIIFVLASVALAHPQISHTPLIKRTTPGIQQLDSVFTDDQREQVENAFFEATYIALAGWQAASDPNDKLLTKYFAPSDRARVQGALARVLGLWKPNSREPPKLTKQPEDYTEDDVFEGSPMLGRINVYKDFPGSRGKLHCAPNGDTVPGAELVGGDSWTTQRNPDLPIIVLCEAVLKLPNLGSGPTMPGRTCADIKNANGDNMSAVMNILAGVILHEYMHWEDLTAPVFRGRVVDATDALGKYIGYGLRAVLRLGHHISLLNADSYMWFALHAYWTKECGMDLEIPTPGRGEGAKGARSSSDGGTGGKRKNLNGGEGGRLDADGRPKKPKVDQKGAGKGKGMAMG